MSKIKQISVNQRIKFLIDDYEKCSQKYFAEKINVSPSAISSLFSKRENKPGLEMLQKIAIAYPEVGLDWLLIGRGPMLKNEKAKQMKESPVSAESLEASEGAIDHVFNHQASRYHVDGQVSPAMAERHDIISSELRFLSNRIAELAAKGHNLMVIKQKTAEQDRAYNEINDEYLNLIEIQRHKRSELKTLRQMEINAMQEVKSTIYRIGGAEDMSKPFGGLLPHRLDISEANAQNLVASGLIRAVFIEGEGYRVSEQAVCEYLGESSSL